jgi:transposase
VADYWVLKPESSEAQLQPIMVGLGFHVQGVVVRVIKRVGTPQSHTGLRRFWRKTLCQLRDTIEERADELLSSNEDCQWLRRIPGIEPIAALTILAEVSATLRVTLVFGTLRRPNSYSRNSVSCGEGRRGIFGTGSL